MTLEESGSWLNLGQIFFSGLTIGNYRWQASGGQAALPTPDWGRTHFNLWGSCSQGLPPPHPQTGRAFVHSFIPGPGTSVMTSSLGWWREKLGQTSVHFGSALRAFPLPALSPPRPPALGSFKPKGPFVWESHRRKPFPSLWCSTRSSTGAGPWGEVDRGRGGGVDTSAV